MRKAAQDPFRRLNQTVHQIFFWICGFFGGEDGRSCDFVLIADASGAEARQLMRNYREAIQKPRLALVRKSRPPHDDVSMKQG